MQLPAKETSRTATPATSKPENASKPLVKPEGSLPERSALESLESLALALVGWPPATPKPATLSESLHRVDDAKGPKVSNYQGPMKRSHHLLAKTSNRAEIRNFSRPLGTPRSPLEFSQSPPSNVARPPRRGHLDSPKEDSCFRLWGIRYNYITSTTKCKWRKVRRRA